MYRSEPRTDRNSFFRGARCGSELFFQKLPPLGLWVCVCNCAYVAVHVNDGKRTECRKWAATALLLGARGRCKGGVSGGSIHPACLGAASPRLIPSTAYTRGTLILSYTGRGAYQKQRCTCSAAVCLETATIASAAAAAANAARAAGRRRRCSGAASHGVPTSVFQNHAH